MKMLLPKVAVAEHVRLTRETEVFKQIEILRVDIVRVAKRLKPTSILALAMLRFPELSAEQAFEKFRAEASEFIAALVSSAEELQADFNAEKERAAPILAAAARRNFAILDRIRTIDAIINSNQRRDAEKRKRLTDAGLKGDELESAAASINDSELTAERDALLVENERLEKFLLTRNELDLPEGFASELREAA
jgi:hypothetical protein